jgi:DNA modification methylase
MTDDFQLIHGDCIEAMRAMPDNSVDMVLTSPPYDNLRTYNGSLEWGGHVWKPVIENLHRILVSGGTVVWVVNDVTINGSETGTSFRQALHFMETGFNLHDTMVYLKPGFTAVGALTTRYAQVFDYMFVFTIGRIKTFNPIKDRPCKHAGKKVSGTIRQKDGSVKRMSSEGETIRDYGQRYNVLEISHQSQEGHPAPFPDRLARDHVISWSNAGDIVLDCFMGSGTTGVVCANLDRKFIGIEKDAEYFEIARKRIEAAKAPTIGDMLQ